MRYALCTILLALGGAIPSLATGQPQDAPTVHAVVIRGNEAVSEDDILDRLATHPPEGLIFAQRYVYDPIALAADRERIERLYRERGYFNARVTDTRVVELSETRVGVRIDIDEGEPARIQRLQILGLPDNFEPTERLALELSRLREGEIIRHETYLQARQQLRRALRERGHAHASVSGSVRVDRDEATAVVTLRADPGPRVRYGELEVSGLERIPESAVRNRVAWQPGDVYSPQRMETTRGRLYELGYLSSVRLELPSEGEVVDVEVRATEGPRREVQFGGGLALDNTFFEVRGRAGFLVRGLHDPLLSARMAARPAYQIQRADPGPGSLGGEASITLERIDLVLPRSIATAQLAARSTEFEAYDARGALTRLGWGIPLFEDRVELRGGWELRPLFELVNVHPAILENPDVADAIGADVSPYRLGNFNQSFILDLRDSIVAPTRGVLFSHRFEQGGRFAGGSGDLTYVSSTTELRGYLPIGNRLVAAARGQIGTALAGDIPITQRYLAGGASSHRGFGHRRLSPTLVTAEDIDRDPVARIGGGALLESSYELRTRITRVRDEWLGLTFFADAGDVTMEIRDLDLGNLHWALGTGVRYNTIIGPIRLDLGYRITSLPSAGGPVEGNRLVVHFSLGEAF